MLWFRHLRQTYYFKRRLISLPRYRMHRRRSMSSMRRRHGRRDSSEEPATATSSLLGGLDSVTAGIGDADTRVRLDPNPGSTRQWFLGRIAHHRLPVNDHTTARKGPLGGLNADRGVICTRLGVAADDVLVDVNPLDSPGSKGGYPSCFGGCLIGGRHRLER